MDIREVLKKDYEERQAILRGMQRMRNRQVVIIFILITIFMMFLAIYFNQRTQIEKQDAVIITMASALTQGSVIMTESENLIHKQDSTINLILEERKK